jgi:hypothetical protein
MILILPNIILQTFHGVYKLLSCGIFIVFLDED